MSAPAQRSSRPERHLVASHRSSTALQYRTAFLSRLAAGALLLAIGATSVEAAGIYYVDTNHPSASDANPGTEAQPYKTIDRAVTVRGGPGTEIRVKAGRYPEQITITKSGTAAEPFVVRAWTQPVVVDGANDLSWFLNWAPSGGSSYRSPITFQPSQVLVDSVRLAATAALPAAMPVGTYRYVAGDGIYVNIGGANPGTRSTFLSERLYGFRITGARYVLVDGFEVTRAGNHAIYFPSGGSNVTILNNQATWSGIHGIAASACTTLWLESNVVRENLSHGVSLIGVTDGLVQKNEVHDNGVVAEDFAVGIRLFGSSGNTIRRNRIHHNVDSGVELADGSSNNALTLNLSYLNGDHGFGHLSSPNNTHNSNVAWRNYRDGISSEGGSTGIQVWNTILANNGVDTGRFNLVTDSTSITGSASDYNMIWNFTAQNPIRQASTQYATIAAFTAATGKDAASYQSNPRFVDGDQGDFRLESGSKAIDSGHAGSPFWQIADFSGGARADDPVSPNTGSGAPPYADRGAFEFVRTGSVSVEDAVVNGVALSAPHPNPARGGVALALQLPHDATVSWQVLDVQGRIVWGESARRYTAGRTVLRWSGVDGSGAPAAPGLYLARVSTGAATLARRIVVVR